ncbi:hypothetical protein [Methylomonas sp. DH-1]|uniref:hypothetical protein n=1 Tax=Methylomonas sp. (strain DH-1) TaxID=1727196 RepID=UPI0007C953A1|nr:hypothetical protein [Methylomonas sp. DH-1]ANE56113.1 hypothetical protein AYM39_13610 [Methylomonas sp. DH-1]
MLLSGLGNCSSIHAVEKKEAKEKAAPHRIDPALLENHSWFPPCGPAFWLFKFAPGKFLGFGEGFRKGCLSPPKMRGLLAVPHAGLFSPKAAMLGAV